MVWQKFSLDKNIAQRERRRIKTWKHNKYIETSLLAREE